METSDYVSLLSIIVSIVTAIAVFKYTKKNNTINLMYNNYKVLLDDILLIDLPAALEDAIKNKLQNFKKVDETITKMHIKMKFYKYLDKKFYDSVYKKITAIDDFTSTLNNRNNFDFIIEEKKLSILVNELYEEVFKKLTNG